MRCQLYRLVFPLAGILSSIIDCFGYTHFVDINNNLSGDEKKIKFTNEHVIYPNKLSYFIVDVYTNVVINVKRLNFQLCSTDTEIRNYGENEIEGSYVWGRNRRFLSMRQVCSLYVTGVHFTYVTICYSNRIKIIRNV